MGWYVWSVKGRKASFPQIAEPQVEALGWVRPGCLIGDRIIFDEDRTPSQVYFVEPGLVKFTRISVGKIYPEGPWIYRGLEMPLGVEDAVLHAFEDRLPSLDGLKHVTPALSTAFRIETEYRLYQERLEVDREEKRRQEEERARVEEMRRRLGDAGARREIAKIDFEAAARAALREGGAEFLSTMRGQRGEHIVRYKVDLQRLECVVDDQLHILDAGICLTDHDTGIKYDDILTLESLPSVVREAEREGRLVVWRHG